MLLMLTLHNSYPATVDKIHNIPATKNTQIDIMSKGKKKDEGEKKW